MNAALSFFKSFWAQVFGLLALIALLDRSTGFRTDIGALAGTVPTVAGALRV